MDAVIARTMPKQWNIGTWIIILSAVDKSMPSPFGLAFSQFLFLMAVVAYADLHESLHVFELQGVVEDGGVRVFEAFEGFAQVAVGVGVQDAVFHALFVQVLVIGEGTAVVAA